VRVACEHLSEPGLRGDALLAGLASAAGVFYNFSGQVRMQPAAPHPPCRPIAAWWTTLGNVPCL